MSDALTDSGRFRVLAVMDDCTRECLALVADTSLSGVRVGREPDAIIARRGRLRDELLNETLFTSLVHAREALAIWQDDYNTVRPHSAIGNVPPFVYAKLSDLAKQQNGPLELSWGSAPHPVASLSQSGSNDVRALLPTG